MTIYKNGRPIIEIGTASYFTQAFLHVVPPVKVTEQNYLDPREDIPKAIIYLSTKKKPECLRARNIIRDFLSQDNLSKEDREYYLKSLEEIDNNLVRIDEAITQLKFFEQMAKVKDIDENGKEKETWWAFNYCEGVSEIDDE